MDLNPISWFQHASEAALKAMIIHLIFPIILFVMAFLTVILAPLPVLMRLIIAAVMVMAGLYLGGWLPAGLGG